MASQNGTLLFAPVEIFLNLPFANSLGSVEASVVKETHSSIAKSVAFSEDMEAKLSNFLSRCGGRVCPTPRTLQLQLSSIAKYEFQVKPVAAFCAIASGVPSTERPGSPIHWKTFTYCISLSVPILKR